MRLKWMNTDQPTGLTEEQREELQVAAMGFDDVGMTPFSEGLREAFPEVFAEPEPGADIPDEVVDEALDSFMNALEGHERPKGLKVRNFMRAALAAADAKRAELSEPAKGGKR